MDNRGRGRLLKLTLPISATRWLVRGDEGTLAEGRTKRWYNTRSVGIGADIRRTVFICDRQSQEFHLPGYWRNVLTFSAYLTSDNHRSTRLEAHFGKGNALS